MKENEILVVEDNESMRLGITESMRRDGYIVSDFNNGPDALEYFRNNNTFLAILDLKMTPLDGIQILEKIKEINPETEVLMISAYGSVNDAVKAMHLGAADFLTKPFSQEELKIRINKLSQKIQNRRQIESLMEQNRLLSDELYTGYDEIIGESKAIKEVFGLIDRIAVSDSPVLINGESGTGKELVARAIHKKSGRNDKPFIKNNCGAFNENLLESELFGHEKGAFTGAIKQKKGRFELSDNGTLFLDEIGDVSLAMQVKLLRVLQEGEFERVGGEVTLSTDVRIISATNKDLQKEIGENKFREDLYFRLNVIPINLPSLRERREDIPLLVNHFNKRLACKYNREPKVINTTGMEILMNYSWPGNIRELENLLERLFFVSPSNSIDADLISKQLFNVAAKNNHYDKMPLDEAVSAFEKQLIIQAMKNAGDVKNQAAKLLGIKTSTLYYKLEKYGLI